MNYALITGGSRGIGRAICIAIAEHSDYGILINYNSNEQAAEDTKKMVEEHGNVAQTLCFNVANKEAVDTCLEKWHEEHPDDTIEVLVNNAGINDDALFLWMEENAWNKVIQTSLNGFYHCTQFVLQKMLRKRYGRIVNIVSVSGLRGTEGQTNYSAAKGGVIAATKSLAREIAKRNVTVNAVAPGFIESDMTRDLDKTELAKQIPIQRFGKPEEVADLVQFLVSKKASYITGEVINVNGGMYS